MKNITLLLAIAFCTSTALAQTTAMKHEFTASELPWRIVNDGVMGGLSKSQMQETAEGHALFTGTVSLENNGGFASTRTDVPDEASTGTRTIQIRVKGDGNRYSFRLNPKGPFGRVSYRAYFDTEAGKWQAFTLPVSDFTPTFRGRVLPDTPSLEGQTLEEMGILIADKQEGAFELVIDWIKMD
jgi:monofunctional biosynthetic peptidoglycan transglycosylase